MEGLALGVPGKRLKSRKHAHMQATVQDSQLINNQQLETFQAFCTRPSTPNSKTVSPAPT